MPSDDSSIRIRVCHNHFQRVRDNNICDRCPSVDSHEEIVMDLARLEAEAEIKMIRDIQDKVGRMETALNGDGNGEKGLKWRVTQIERDLRRSANNVGNYIAASACIIAVISCVIAMVK